MEKLITDLLKALELDSSAEVKVRPEGLYIEDYFYALGPNTVIKSHYNAEHDDMSKVINPVARALIMRITSDKEMLTHAIKGKISAILNFTTPTTQKARYDFIGDDVKFKIEEERVIIRTQYGMFRINTVTYNVTCKMTDGWIIQPSDYQSHVVALIDELNGWLIQAAYK